jgi:flagellar basal body-associated protein FliL
MLRIKTKTGQSVLEYIILIVIIIAALLTLQIYMKRGLQGRLKSATDDIGDQYTQAAGANYYKVHTVTTNSWNNNTGGTQETTLVAAQITNDYMHINFQNSDGEYWGK